jgi:hypothetical protein
MGMQTILDGDYLFDGYAGQLEVGGITAMHEVEGDKTCHRSRSR